VQTQNYRLNKTFPGGKMKNFAIALLSLCATTAMACPDLTGTYQCEKDPNNTADTGVISLATDPNGGYIYTDKDDAANAGNLPTDGQTYQEGQDSYTGSCSGNDFNVVLTGVDQQVGPYTVNITFNLDASKNLVEAQLIKFNYGGQPQQQNHNETCTRL
jgi:hypothetical protein